MGSYSSSTSPLSNIITTTTPMPASGNLAQLTIEKNDLLHRLQNLKKDHCILDKQLRQSTRDYGDLLLVNSETGSELAESRREAAELRAELNRLNSENGERHELTHQLMEVRLELKQLKHNSKEANAELEETRKKAETLEAENWVLREVGEAAKAEVEKVRKEKEEVVSENRKLERVNDAIMKSATVKYNEFEKRVVNLETCLATINLIPPGSQASEGAPVSQQTMDNPAVVYVDISD